MNLNFFSFVSSITNKNQKKEHSNTSANQKFKLPSIAYVNITDPIPLKTKRKKTREKMILKFSTILSTTSIINLEKLREISWVGIPIQYRSRCWRLLLDYEPTNTEQASNILQHKRNDYFNCKSSLFRNNQNTVWTSVELTTLNQIKVDIPRTSHSILKNQRVSNLFISVLFTWAIRHPASSYVQGMNEVLLPFFICFISPFYPKVSLDNFQIDNVDLIDEETLNNIEADCFWCFSRLMDGIQDVYTRDQPGMHRMNKNIEKVVSLTSPDLDAWIKKEEISYINFTVRWFNCLLVREFKLKQLLRIWDLLLSDPLKASEKIVYICAAMLKFMKPMLMNLPRPEFVETIQTNHPDFWTDERVEMILAQSFVYEQNIDIEEILPRC